MESQPKREISQVYFVPLKSFKCRPLFHSSVANNKQMVLAKNLHRSYRIPEENALRLIMYTEIALSYTTESEIQVYYSDLKEIADFEKDPFQIEKVVFKGGSKDAAYTRSFEIANPYLIDSLYNSMIELLDFQKITKEKHKKEQSTSATIIQKVATELYIELTEKEKISKWKALCIIGFIFSLYKVGLKKDEPIMTEEEYNAQKEARNAKEIIITESYLQYLGDQIKSYINMEINP